MLPLFIEAGWSSSRQVPVSPKISRDHPAFEVFRQFGGLVVGRTGAGLDCARSDIIFNRPDDEVLHEGAVWAKLLDTTLIGVAEVHDRHGALLMDSRGRCFGMSYMHDAFSLEGHNFSEAVERLLLGSRRARPMLRPDQPFVTLYGDKFTHDHPAVFRYRSNDGSPTDVPATG